jgi:hypothetical protein
MPKYLQLGGTYMVDMPLECLNVHGESKALLTKVLMLSQLAVVPQLKTHDSKIIHRKHFAKTTNSHNPGWKLFLLELGI